MAETGRNRRSSTPLTPSQERLALLLAQGVGVRAASRDTKVAERTIHRWKALPSFAARVAEIQSEIYGDVAARLLTVSQKATMVLLDLLDADSSDGIRYSAARSVLDLACRWREGTELTKRLAELAQRLDALEKQQPQSSKGG